MAKKRERNKNATYSDEFKLKVLEFFDETGEDIIKTLDRFSISRSSFYAWKHRHWDTYLEIKEKNLKKVVTNAALNRTILELKQVNKAYISFVPESS